MATFRFAVLSDVHLGAPRFGLPELALDGLLALEEALDAAASGGAAFVLVAGNLFDRTRVAPEVLAGLEAGDEVVTQGSFLLKTELLKGSIGAGCCEVHPGT